jgi:hypothetical protein
LKPLNDGVFSLMASHFAQNCLELLMPDDLTKRGPQDRSRISKQPHEQAYQKRKASKKTAAKASRKK